MQKPRARSSSTYITRRRWTEDDAREALAAFEASGLTMAAFAAREGLDRQRLERWRRTLGERVAALAFEEIPRSAIVRVAAESGALASALEIVLPSGRVIRVPPAFDTTTLRRLLAVLEEVDAC